MSQTETESTKKSSSSSSLDWFVRGILTRTGDILDRFTGRNWKPSSNLATSQLIEKLKVLLDSEAKNVGENGKVVPHHIQLKMQWDKFSTDAAETLEKLKNELLTAAIDHINDSRYHTYAPLQLDIKTDYFTEGVKLTASFDEFADEKEEDEEVPEINLSVPADLRNVVIAAPEEKTIEPEKEIFKASFVAGNQAKQIRLVFAPKERKSVGRTKENDLCIDDASVSKLHATLFLNAENRLAVADTGSTNGTFINGERIGYGKAVELKDTDELKFGAIEVEIEKSAKAAEESQTNVAGISGD